MTLLRRLTLGLRALARPDLAERETADEVEHYLREAAAAHRALGLSEQEALRAARLELGSPAGVREEVRRYGWENGVEAFLGDLRYAVRRLRMEPGFTAIATLTLGLGIGAATAIFSAVNYVLIRPLPYPDAERILAVWDTREDGAQLDIAYGTARELAARARSLEHLAAMKPWQPTLLGAAEPERLEGQQIGADYFEVLGVRPALGHEFSPPDDAAGAAPVAVLSDGLWRRRFGAEPGVIGRTVTLDGLPYQILGVMPPRFENAAAPGVEVWTPLGYDMSQGRAWGHHLRLLARARPGASLDEVRRELETIALHPVADFPRVPWAALEHGFRVRPLQDEVTAGARPALLALLGAVGIVLAVACVNVAGLLLARGARRRGELAVRAALGAGHQRLIRQLLTESLVLSLLGGAAGVGVAAVAVRALVALSPAGMPRAHAIAVDATALVFALAVSMAVAVAVGLLPAFAATRGDLREAVGRGPAPARHGPGRDALVVAQVMLALVLLVGSGLLFRSVRRLLAVDAGFDAPGLVTMQIQASGPRLEDDSTRLRFFAAALEAVRQVPGVAAAALTSQLPLSGEDDRYGLHLDPAPAADPGELGGGTYRYAVSPDYLRTMGVPLLRGRGLASADDAGAPRVAVVSASLARRRFPGVDPIGHRIRVGPADSPPYTIVGVVGDVKQISLALDEGEAVYMPVSQWHFADRVLSLVVRARGKPGRVVPAVRSAVWSVDPDQAVVRVAAMEDLVKASAEDRRFALWLFEGFALAALVLVGVGVYGSLSGRVAERTREIGVRAALGASRGALVALVLRRGLALMALGIALGVAAALAATRAITSLLYGVSPLDAVTYLGVVALLGIVALIAGSLPAWRAARVDPALPLRTE
jgi:putative ABC transport system permease protein